MQIDQRDREAAAEITRQGMGYPPREAILAGERDEWHLVQAFARHRSADTARIAELEREVARLREAHGGSHSFTAGHGPTGEFVTLTFHTKAGRERFIDAHIAAIQAQVATTALGGQP